MIEAVPTLLIELASVKESDKERFFRHTLKSEGCWMWNARIDQYGYGAFKFCGKDLKAHRFSWTIHNGEIPIGLWVLHKCDNRSCVRPDHLFLGTVLENVRDMMSKGRKWIGDTRQNQRAKTHCGNGHEYTPENTRWYNNRRNCRECERGYQKKYAELARLQTKTP